MTGMATARFLRANSAPASSTTARPIIRTARSTTTDWSRRRRAHQETGSHGLSVFLQDTFNVTDCLSVNLGVRTERFAHIATGRHEHLYLRLDAGAAPQRSVRSGTGRQRISAFYGKYYDPIRNNLTNFAGTLSGSIREEQVYVNDQWVTYRVRGGPEQADALFAPTTKTPWTDDVQLSYETDPLPPHATGEDVRPSIANKTAVCLDTGQYIMIRPDA